MNPNPTVLGQRLRTARRTRGWTLQDLAERARLPITTLHYYETGQSDPPASKLLRLAKVLGLDLGEIQRSRSLWAA